MPPADPEMMQTNQLLTRRATRCGASAYSRSVGPLAIFPALAFLVLAAHFFRAGDLAPFALSLLFLPLLVVPRAWAARALQAGLALGAVVWIRTLAAFAGQRRAAGLPYTRLALILGGVALATAACLLVFRSERVRRFFRLA